MFWEATRSPHGTGSATELALQWTRLSATAGTANRGTVLILQTYRAAAVKGVTFCHREAGTLFGGDRQVMSLLTLAEELAAKVMEMKLQRLRDVRTCPLARLQLGRAQRLMGDNASARESYEEFLTIWKDADPDVPVYRQAKAEYAQLKRLRQPRAMTP
jgi:hypothetical protein